MCMAEEFEQKKAEEPELRKDEKLIIVLVSIGEVFKPVNDPLHQEQAKAKGFSRPD